MSAISYNNQIFDEINFDGYVDTSTKISEYGNKPREYAKIISEEFHSLKNILSDVMVNYITFLRFFGYLILSILIPFIYLFAIIIALISAFGLKQLNKKLTLTKKKLLLKLESFSEEDKVEIYHDLQALVKKMNLQVKDFNKVKKYGFGFYETRIKEVRNTLKEMEIIARKSISTNIETILTLEEVGTLKNKIRVLDPEGDWKNQSSTVAHG